MPNRETDCVDCVPQHNKLKGVFMSRRSTTNSKPGRHRRLLAMSVPALAVGVFGVAPLPEPVASWLVPAAMARGENPCAPAARGENPCAPAVRGENPCAPAARGENPCAPAARGENPCAPAVRGENPCAPAARGENPCAPAAR
jgi:hypothetical protein